MKLKNWLLTNYKGDKLSKGWFTINIVLIILAVLTIVSIVFQ